MTYVKTNWENGKTPINATNLNKIEEGIANAVETDSEARVSNVVSRNMLDLNKCNLGRCKIQWNGLISDITDFYYCYIEANYLIEWILANKGKTITLSVGKVIPNRNIAIVIFGTFSDGSTYQVAEINDSSEVSLTISENLLTITSFELRFNAYSEPFNDTITTIPYMQLELGDKASSPVQYLNLEEAMLGDVYSTREQRIGTWTNGKPLYRKVVECGYLNAGNQTISHNIKDIDEITDVIASFRNENIGTWFPIPRAYPTDMEKFGVSIDVGKSDITLTNGSNYNGTIFLARAIIEYTKTTD